MDSSPRKESVLFNPYLGGFVKLWQENFWSGQAGIGSGGRRLRRGDKIPMNVGQSHSQAIKIAVVDLQDPTAGAIRTEGAKPRRRIQGQHGVLEGSEDPWIKARTRGKNLGPAGHFSNNTQPRTPMTPDFEIALESHSGINLALQERPQGFAPAFNFTHVGDDLRRAKLRQTGLADMRRGGEVRDLTEV